MEHKRFRKTVKNFLTIEECIGFITVAKNGGFDESKINTRTEGQVMDKSIRNNDKHTFTARDLAHQLWSIIKEHVPAQIEGYDAVGINEMFRIYRYQNGQEFKVHLDGAFKRDNGEDSTIDEYSKLTVLIYLNDDFEGGETEFVMPHEIIKPESGMMLLFAHKQMHKGNTVPTGTKYVLRTDVMYRKEK